MGMRPSQSSYLKLAATWIFRHRRGSVVNQEEEQQSESSDKRRSSKANKKKGGGVSACKTAPWVTEATEGGAVAAGVGVEAKSWPAPLQQMSSKLQASCLLQQPLRGGGTVYVQVWQLVGWRRGNRDRHGDRDW